MIGRLIGVTGLPGTGKTTFALSAAEVGKTAVAVTDLKEEESYASLEAPHIVKPVYDVGWRPRQDKYAAAAFEDLLKWVTARQADDCRNIAIDTATEASEFALHAVMAMAQTDDPSSMDHGRAYTGHNRQFQALINEATICASKGKNVIMIFHGGMKELEGAGEAQLVKGRQKDTSGQPVLEWQFEEKMLPVLMGTNKYAQNIGAKFPLWLYSFTTGFGPGTKYWLTAIPDKFRPAKHSVGIKFKDKVDGKPFLANRIPNNLKALLGAME
jgi:hypothetical protein